MSELPEGHGVPCKHLNFELRPEDDVGTCTCRDCGVHLYVAEAFNNLQHAVFAQYDALKKVVELFERKAV